MLKRVFISYIFANKLAFKICKWKLFLLLGIKVILGLLPVALIWCTERLINSVNIYVNSNLRIMDVLLFFTLEVLITLSIFVLQKISLIVEQKNSNIFKVNLKKILFSKQHQIQFERFEDHEFQNRLSRINSNDTQMIQVVNNGIDFFSNLISLTGILIYLISNSWIFGPLLLVGMIPMVIVQFKFGRKRYELFKFLTPFGRKEHYVNSLLNNPRSLQEIRLFSIEEHIVQKWINYNQTNATKNLNILISQSKWLMLTQIVQMIVYFASGLLSIYLIIKKIILVGSFVAILQSIHRIQGTLNILTNSLSEIYESTFLINDFKEYLNMQEMNSSSKTKINDVYDLRIHNLSFKYPNTDNYALKNININIPRGKKIAIVGVNGSGKTTLLKCLTGLYFTENAVKINNIKIEDVNLKTYHNCITVLSQDFNEYEFTVKENIGLGRIEAIDNNLEIQQAAMKTDIHSHIMKLPQEYESKLGRQFNNGNELSGGQWQKIALSRALFRKGDIVFLDEPTSSLDPKSELEIIESLFNDSTGNQSIVYITHRLAATKFADEILVLKDGEVVEQGTHNELLQLNGEYFSLYEYQKQWYLDTNSKEGVIG